jgi:hypothetical protein
MTDAGIDLDSYLAPAAALEPQSMIELDDLLQSEQPSALGISQTLLETEDRTVGLPTSTAPTIHGYAVSTDHDHDPLSCIGGPATVTAINSKPA